MIFTLLLYLVLILALLRYAIYKAQRRRLETMMDKLDGPKTIPIFGNLNMCFGSSKVVLKRAYHELYRRKSPTRLWIGPIPMVMIRDPKNFQIVCNETLVKSNEYKFMRDFLGQGLITANGEKWRQNRRNLNPAFNINLMSTHFLSIFNEINAKLLKSLDGLASSGQEIDLWEYIFKCTRDTICVTAMGYREGKTEDEDKDRSDVLKYGALLEKAGTLVTERMMKPWLHPLPIFQLYNFITGNEKVFEKAYELPLQIIRKKKEEMLDANNNYSKPQTQAEEEESKRTRNFIDILLSSDVFKNLPERELAEEVVTFILAGSETSAVTICFTLLMLGKYPEYQERVYEELMTAFDGDCDRPVELEDLKHLPYLEQCIKETLRRFPSVALILRKVEKDIVLAGGEILPAGVSAVLAIIGIHLSEELYDKPFAWNPDRFSPEEVQKRHPCSFIPFSVGPRSCIGAKYAMFTIKTQLATILRKYKFSTNLRIRDIKLGFDIILRNKTGYKTTVIRRN